MLSLNNWKGTGNLLRDPELRKTTKGNSVMDMRIVLDNPVIGKADAVEPCYVDIELYGTKAVSCHKYLKKGSLVFVEGALKTDSWISKKENKKHYKLSLRATYVRCLDTKESVDPIKCPQG